MPLTTVQQQAAHAHLKKENVWTGYISTDNSYSADWGFVIDGKLVGYHVRENGSRIAFWCIVENGRTTPKERYLLDCQHRLKSISSQNHIVA